MKNLNGEVKFSFADILLSPFMSIWNMAKSEEDVSDDIELNPNSSDKIEAVLANNQNEIDKKVETFGGHSKAQRKEMLNKTKVDTKTLKENTKNRKEISVDRVQEKESINKGNERGE